MVPQGVRLNSVFGSDLPKTSVQRGAVYGAGRNRIDRDAVSRDGLGHGDRHGVHGRLACGIKWSV